MDKRSRPLTERFMDKVFKSDDGCWLWTGAKMSTGYGLIWKGTKNVAAHRESFKLFIGPLDDDEVVCHKCDVRHCVNPDHFFKGTRADNNLDMRQKKRHRFGETSPMARMTEDDVAFIKASPETNTALAKRYGVNQSTISRIRSGHRWVHSSTG